MARIRAIKPDFWTDEKVVELSAFARLLFIGLWNFADDDGRMAYSPKKIKMQIFPADALDISELIGELRSESIITVYAVDNVDYLQINNFAKHQKIDKRTPSKLPCIEESSKIPPNSPESPRIPHTEGKGREGNGREWNGMEKPTMPPDGDALPCPVEKLVSAYHEKMPINPRCKVINSTRRGAIKQRWREAAKLNCEPFGYSTVEDGLSAWSSFFEVCASSPFLTGQSTPQHGKPLFVADIDFLFAPSSFAKCLENKYHRNLT